MVLSVGAVLAQSKRYYVLHTERSKNEFKMTKKSLIHLRTLMLHKLYQQLYQQLR